MRAVTPETCLAAVNPELAAQWHPNNKLTPHQVLPGADRYILWVGECGHEWEAKVYKRSQGRGCPYCSKTRKRLLSGFNDLATVQPDIGRLMVHLVDNPSVRADGVLPGARKNLALWKHPDCGHEWIEFVDIQSRRTEKPCPYCAKRQVLAGFNDLATTHPAIASQWDSKKTPEISPHEVFAGSATYVWWKCDRGHSTRLRVADKVKVGCSTCSNRIIVVGENDLATTHPDIASQWHPTLNGDFTPQKVVAGSDKTAWWECQEGHAWESAVKSRIYMKTVCSVCSNRKIVPGVNDLATTHPEIAAQWVAEKNTVTPQEVSVGSKVRMTWRGERCGHTYIAEVRQRTSGSSCTVCFTSLMERDVLKIVKLLVGDNVHVTQSMRTVIYGELDIYIPEKKVAIEFNGLYWHSEEGGKGRNYHAIKSKDAGSLGIHLIHVWEDDWLERQDIVVRALAHRLNATERLNEPGVLLVPDESLTRRYGARTLTTEVLAHDESEAFLEANHIQGSTTGTLHTGLRDKEGTLRAVFVAKRVGNAGHEGSWRIERYATRGIVPGGFTKLMKFTEVQIREQDLGLLTQWVTFSDAALSDGGLYRNYGFREDGFVRPDYQYIVGKSRVHKFRYRLKRFRDDPDLQFEEGLSERELALLNKIPRIWDSGKTRWVKPVG